LDGGNGNDDGNDDNDIDDDDIDDIDDGCCTIGDCTDNGGSDVSTAVTTCVDAVIELVVVELVDVAAAAAICIGRVLELVVVAVAVVVVVRYAVVMMGGVIRLW
jgi:hypothetical protein